MPTQILTRDQIRSLAPAAFAAAPADTVSDRYRFISTIDIIDAMEKEDFVVTAARQGVGRSKNFDPLGAHQITFRPRKTIDNLKLLGDSIPEIRLVNSHDRSATYQLTAGMMRLVCLNGLTIADKGTQMAVRGRHMGDDAIGAIIEGSYRIIKEFPAIASKIDAFRDQRLDVEQRLEFASAASLLRWNEPNPELSRLLLTPRREADDNDDLWSVMNVVQENMIRGGFQYQSLAGRTARTTEVINPVADQALNSRLWSLTEAAAEAFA